MTHNWNTSDRRSRLPKNWRAIQSSVLARDKRICQLSYSGCLGTATEVDHITPGDNHHDSNLQAVCSRCHGLKSSREGNTARKRKAALRFRPTERHPGSRN